MNRIQLKDEVRRAVGRQWEAFAREHPNLAQVLDEELLVEHAAASIADDPEYREAMEQAQAIGLGMAALTTCVERLVTRVLRQLV